MSRRRQNTSPWSFENAWWAESLDVRATRFDIIAIAEQLPDDRNQVSLSTQRTPRGWNRLRISWDWNDADRTRADDSSRNLIEMLNDAIGPVSTVPRHRHVRKYSSHHGSGTARMSLDPSTGVVDANCRAHDHPNLYVTGSAVFPTSSYFNPTLTNVALAIRLGDHLTMGVEGGDA